MSSRSRRLFAKSSGSMTAAIEIYNKPLFPVRSEVFSVLSVAAWELLFKARILQMKKNQMSSILVYEKVPLAGGGQSKSLRRKKTRSGNYMTVGIWAALDRLRNGGDKIPASVEKNIEALVEVRDNSVHFMNSAQVDSVVYEVAAASILNYGAFARKWFGVNPASGLLPVLPVSFGGPPEGPVRSNNAERNLLGFIRDSRKFSDEKYGVAVSVDFSVYRTREREGVPIVYSSDKENSVPLFVSEENIMDMFPLTYENLTQRLRSRYDGFKMNQRYHEIRKELEKDSALARARQLNPANPKSQRQVFYSEKIIRRFDSHYKRKEDQGQMLLEEEQAEEVA